MCCGLDIDEKIEGDFKEAEEYAVVFDSVRPIYDTHRTWNLDEFRRVEHSSQALKVRTHHPHSAGQRGWGSGMT